MFYAVGHRATATVFYQVMFRLHPSPIVRDLSEVFTTLFLPKVKRLLLIFPDVFRILPFDFYSIRPNLGRKRNRLGAASACFIFF